MKILLVNDDGVFAPGINALARALKKKHDVVMVAPASERSGFSQSLTYMSPIKAEKVTLQGNEDVEAYAVSGSPADCAKFGVRHVMKWDVDVVISGINNGFNIGTDIYYSGTVGAATEAVMFGVPAIAVSQRRSKTDEIDFDFAAEYIASFLETADIKSLPPRTLLNINFPLDPEKGIKGTKITSQGVLEYNEYYEKIEGEKDTYRLKGKLELDPPEGTDFHAVLNGYVSVSALKYDRTDYLCDKILETMIGGSNG